MKKLMFLTISALFFFACSSESTEKTTEEEVIVAPIPEVVEESVAQEVVQLTIEGDDKMKYNVAELKVPEGAKVELTLTHTGVMAKAAMGHNWVLLKSDTDLPTFAVAAIAAKDNDYIPTSDAIIAHTGLVGGGESTSVSFEAPEKGTYVFICSFPGHYAMMQGKFIVE